jgi:hypothetical protein
LAVGNPHDWIKDNGLKNIGGGHMNTNQMWRLLAYISLAIGIGLLIPAAWGFIAFGVFVVLDTTVLHEAVLKSWLPQRGGP